MKNLSIHSLYFFLHQLTPFVSFVHSFIHSLNYSLFQSIHSFIFFLSSIHPSFNFFHLHSFFLSLIPSIHPFTHLLSFFLSMHHGTIYQCEMFGFGKQSVGIYKTYWLPAIACETHTAKYRLIWITPLGRMKTELFVNVQKPPYIHPPIL